MAAKVGIRFEGEDYVSPTVKHIQGTIAGLGAEAKKSILTGVGLAGGVAAFGALSNAARSAVGFLGDAAHEAIADEESIGRLTQSLKANVPGWDGNTRAIEANFLSKQRLGFKDEDLRASMALMVGATHDVSKAQLLQAAAMDLARFKGIDLATASDALLKVEGGRYRILASLGIQLGKNATQTEVLAAIQKVAGGQAEKFGASTAGAMTAAGIAFSEMQESIGKELLPAITALAKFASNDLIPALKAGIPVLVSISGVVLQLGQIAVPILVIALGSKLVGALKSVGIAAGSTLGPLGAMIGLGLALGDSGKKAGEGAARASIEMRYGAAAAKVFGDALEATGHDGFKAMDALNAYLKQGTGKAADNMDTGMRDIRNVMLSHRGDFVTAARTTWRDPIFEAINEAASVAQAEAAKIPQETGDAMLARQQDLADAATTLIEFMAKALSPAQQRANALGFLQSEAYADGMARGATDPAVLAKTIELRNIALAALIETAPAWNGGVNLGKAWMDGIIAGIASRGSQLSISLEHMKGMLAGNSPPPRGPLKDIDKGAFNIGKAWLGGLNKGMSGALSLPSLGGGGGGGMAFAGASSGGGGPVVIQLQVDGRTLAEIVDQNLYYMKPVQGSLGRG